VIKVKSIIVSGVYLPTILAAWQNSVKVVLETAHMSVLKGLHELKCLYSSFINL